MESLTLPFSVRFRKPFWLAMSTRTGQTAIYSVHGQLMAEQASEALIAFAIDNFVELTPWSAVHGPMRPRQKAAWMSTETVERCFLFSLRDLYTPTRTVIATPDA